MEVERDMAGFTLPFAAGVATVMLFSGTFCAHPHLYSTLSYGFILLSLSFLLHPCHTSFSPRQLRIAAGMSLACCGILCGMSGEILSVGTMHGGGLLPVTEGLGTAMGERIDSLPFASPDTNAIIKALIIGDKSDIPPHIISAFRKSGASHILALSGLHLGIIYGIMVKTSSLLGNSAPARIVRSSAIVLTCGIYTLAVGAGPSIVRAFIFILLGETARLTGRYRSTGTILMAALMIHLVIAPRSFREVGFQLSYAAMAGLAFIFPWLRRFWPETTALKRQQPIRKVWETAAMSISCQITTGPLAYMYFGTFPTHFLLTNLIAIPLTGLIIPIALAVLCLSAMGICPDMLSRAAEALVTALSEALEIISSM